MLDAKALKEERTQLYEDIYNGVIPKRVPVSAGVTPEFSIEYAGLSLADTQWTLKGLAEAYEAICQRVKSDTLPAGGQEKSPVVLKFLNSKGYSMSSSGYIQHHDVTTLEASEYDAFINNPYDFMMEKVLPRMFTALDSDPVTRSLALAKAFKAFFDHAAEIGKICGGLVGKYGYYTPPPNSVGTVRAPFDLLGDFMRGVKGIYTDVRRCPEKVIEACDALLPFQVRRGMPTNVTKHGFTFIPLHLGTHLRTKDFEKIYWPSLYKLVNRMAELGQVSQLYCEHDWMRYLDYLAELPAGTMLNFEFGDPKIVKEKLGKKHIIGGFYPLTYLRTATKEQCVDKAKELVDILAPGGNYIFSFDKSPVSLSSIKPENYFAVVNYVAENAVYSNAGEAVNPGGMKRKIEKFPIPELKSQYYREWDRGDANEFETKIKHLIDPMLENYDLMLLTMLFRNL